MIVTAGTLEESREALKLAKAHPNLYSTVGVHPTRCSEFFGGAGGDDSEAHVAALADVLEEGKELGKVRERASPCTPAIARCVCMYASVFPKSIITTIYGARLFWDEATR